VPVEIGLEAYAEKEVFLPFFTGHVSRGVLLHILRQVDPGVSQQLHQLDVVKPYSVAPLQFKSKAKTGEGYVLDPAYPCRVRFRFLNGDYLRRVIDYFGEKGTVTIIDTTFRIASLAVKSRDYSELEAEAEPLDAFRLYFRSPTYLASLGSAYHCLFPEPSKIFLNLMRLWNTFSTARRFEKDEYVAYEDWVAKNVGVAEYELATRLVHMGRRKAAGFTGWTTYELRNRDPWNKVTCMLAQFAEYSNIGGNRTGGFGVANLVQKPGE